jgi:hypothetical protein
MPEIDMESDVHVNFDLDFTRILLGIDITKKKKKKKFICKDFYRSYKQECLFRFEDFICLRDCHILHKLKYRGN